MPDVAPFTPIWGQEPTPPIVSYPELMGFPCSDLGNLICSVASFGVATPIHVTPIDFLQTKYSFHRFK